MKRAAILEPPPADPIESAGARFSRTVSNPKLSRQQHIHGVLVLVLPLLGTLAAIGMSIYVRPVPPQVLWIALVFYLLAGFGTTIGIHRHFCHGAFRAPQPVRVMLMIFGSMAGSGPVVFWVALHRMHHELADREGDPHSPNLHGTTFWRRLKGLWHAWYGWTIRHDVPNTNFYARDLLRDPLMMRVNNAYFLWVTLGLVLPGVLAGVALGSWPAVLEGILWGGAVRMFLWHNTSLYVITCVVHVFGTRDFESRDLSRNNGWFALTTLGESWHNNHHAFPRAASLNMKWWQLDVSGWAIHAMEKLGLVGDVWAPSAEDIVARKRSLSTAIAQQEHRAQ